jgi:hypothetical protein
MVRLTGWSARLSTFPPRVGPGSSPEGLTLCGFGHSDWEGKKLLRLSHAKAQVCDQLISRSCGAAV